MARPIYGVVTPGMSPEQAQRIRDAQHRAFLARSAREVWSERYRLALATGFSDSDARLHADQAAEIHRKRRSENHA
jgi:hypothetical protein